MFEFISKAAKVVTKGVSGVTKTVGKGITGTGKVVGGAAGALGKGVAHVPLIGSPLSATVGLATGPVQLAADITSGKRIDRAIHDHVKGQLKHAKTVAPYVQTVASVIPGGQGISGAIGAGLALANGQPIDEALVAGIKGAIPGGPVAQAAFSVAHSVIKGKSLDNAAINALPLSDQQKQIVLAGLHASRDIVKGKRFDKIAFNRAIETLPPEAQKALKTGVAVAQGQNLQQSMKEQYMNPAAILGLVKDGKIRLSNPVFKAGNLVMKDNRGFHVGLGLTAKTGVNATAVKAIRNQLAPHEKRGFDMAVATHVGAKKTAPKHLSDREKFGFYAAHGIKGQKPQNKAALLTTLASDNSAKTGAVHALRQQKGLWAKIKKIFGIK